MNEGDTDDAYSATSSYNIRKIIFIRQATLEQSSKMEYFLFDHFDNTFDSLILYQL